MYGSYGHGWMFGNGAGMAFGGFWMILIWVVPLVLLFLLLKALFGSQWKNRSGEDLPHLDKSPLDILKEAYARGDISREEYLRKRDDLLEK